MLADSFVIKNTLKEKDYHAYLYKVQNNTSANIYSHYYFLLGTLQGEQPTMVVTLCNQTIRTPEDCLDRLHRVVVTDPDSDPKYYKAKHQNNQLEVSIPHRLSSCQDECYYVILVYGNAPEGNYTIYEIFA